MRTLAIAGVLLIMKGATEMSQTCDICQQQPAKYDGKTKMGPWAYMCEKCFKAYGVGLGLGKGQVLDNDKKRILE